MAHTEASLIRLNQEDLVKVLLDYQGKFISTLDKLKNDTGKNTVISPDFLVWKYKETK